MAKVILQVEDRPKLTRKSRCEGEIARFPTSEWSTNKMESLKNVLFEVREHVAYITLNRPAAANAVTLELAQELEEVARECDESNSVRAVLLTGNGRIFCGGGDKSFAAQEPTHLPTHLKRVNLFFHSAIQCFARMRAPVVVAVNGPAAGYGMSLACAGDIVLANESARFTMDYTRVGLTPGASQLTICRES